MEVEQMKYYALFNCDEWRSNATMDLFGVFTKDKLIKCLEYDSFELSQPIDKTMSIRELNNVVTYGYIEELKINEVLL